MERHWNKWTRHLWKWKILSPDFKKSTFLRRVSVLLTREEWKSPLKKKPRWPVSPRCWRMSWCVIVIRSGMPIHRFPESEGVFPIAWETVTAVKSWRWWDIITGKWWSMPKSWRTSYLKPAGWRNYISEMPGIPRKWGSLWWKSIKLNWPVIIRMSMILCGDWGVCLMPGMSILRLISITNRLLLLSGPKIRWRPVSGRCRIIRYRAIKPLSVWVTSARSNMRIRSIRSRKRIRNTMYRYNMILSGIICCRIRWKREWWRKWTRVCRSVSGWRKAGIIGEDTGRWAMGSIGVFCISYWYSV